MRLTVGNEIDMIALAVGGLQPSIGAENHLGASALYARLQRLTRRRHLIFYRRFPGDYGRKTRHLSLEQHGAYCLLLDHQYSTEVPLPCLEHCLRICSAMTPEHIEAVTYVYNTFFPQGINPRFEEEVLLANSRRTKAKRGAEAKWNHAPSNAPSIRGAYAPDMHNQTTRLQTPDSETSETRDVQKTHISLSEAQERLASGVHVFETPQFQKFWNAYPIKLDQKEAFRQWMRVPFADREVAQIVAGLERWKVSERWADERYIPTAAKFLSDRRWEKAPPMEQRKRGLDERELERIKALRR